MKLAKHLFYSLKAVPALGLRGSIRLFAAHYLQGLHPITPRGYAAPVWVRGGTSDPAILSSIIGGHEYKTRDLGHVQRIVDAGANIGVATVYFANRYPNAEITAIEPEASNFEMLVMNTRHLPNVKSIRAAVWPSKCRLKIVNTDAEKWCFEYMVASDNEASDVDVIPLSDLVCEGLDLLKMDVEGGEREIFRQDNEWVHRVRHMLIEIHPGCWKAVFEALKDRSYDCRIIGENIHVSFGKN